MKNKPEFMGLLFIQLIKDTFESRLHNFTDFFTKVSDKTLCNFPTKVL